MKEKILEQRLSGIIGMFLGGFFLLWLGFGCVQCMLMFENASVLTVIPWIFVLLGIRWGIIAIAVLVTRSRLQIRISDKGINLPMGIPSLRENASGMYISRSDIKSINRYASLHCRGVEIVKEDGSKVIIQIRNYCSIKDFLAYCKEMELPC